MISRSVGEMTITAVHDGRFFAPHDAVMDFDPQRVAELTGVPVGRLIPFDVNCYLVRTIDHTILIDVGGGTWTTPTLGQLMKNLRALGVAPETFDTVLLTHCHPDHSNGLVDAAGEPVFQGATVVLHEKEAAFWLDRDLAETDSERITRGCRGARRALAPYANRIRRVGNGEVLPGISAVLRAGHTPGHTTWLLESGKRRVLVWGDTVHFTDVQVAYPEAGLVFDIDPVAASASRREVFEWLAAEQVTVAGAHLGFPGFGRIALGPDGFVLHQAPT